MSPYTFQGYDAFINEALADMPAIPTAAPGTVAQEVCANGTCHECHCYCDSATWQGLGTDISILDGIADGNNFLGRNRNQLLAALNCYMQQCGMTQCLEKAHFLAQLAHESEMFKRTEERGNEAYFINKHYEGGPLYHGRGYIQITGRTNYRKYLSSIGIQVNDMNVMSIKTIFEEALGASFWFWRKHENYLTSKALRNDFLAVTATVNGGFNGALERKKYLHILANKMCIKNCTIHHDKRFDRFYFNESSLPNWHNKDMRLVWNSYFGESEWI